MKVIEEALQENEFAIGIFCDLSKAFDTLDHDVLLQKLDHYGIRGKWYTWLKSYLAHRKQFVDLNGEVSSTKNISVGVPQGSILGPLLFLIYINDLPAALKKLIAIMFADDTNLIIKGNNIAELSSAINQDLITLSDFFRANKLKLNVGKTNMVCFRKKSLEFAKEQLIVTLDGEQIACENQATFLGITLDSHLSWEPHCNRIANRMAQNAGVLNRVKNFIPLDSRKILYHSLVSSHFTYGLEAWGSCQPRFTQRIRTIQKKAIRSVSNSGWLSHSEPRMRNLGILAMQDQYRYQCAGMIFDMLHGHAPDVYNFTQEQSRNCPQNTRSTSSKPKNLRLGTFSSKNFKSFSSFAPEIWNSLSSEIQKSTSKSIFKHFLKKEILGKYSKKVECKNPRCTDQRYHV